MIAQEASFSWGFAIESKGDLFHGNRIKGAKTCDLGRVRLKTPLY
jgi:hypothetical protein